MMKRIFLLPLLALLSAAFVFAGEAERVFTLEESITTGLHNSQKYLASIEEVSLAQQIISESRSLMFPKIDLDFNAMQFHNFAPTVSAPSFGSVLLPGEFKDQYYLTRVSLYQNVYAGGKYLTNIRVAETNYAQAKGRSEVVRNEVIRDIKLVFYKYLAALERKKSYEIAKTTVESFKDPKMKEKWNDFGSQMVLDIQKSDFEINKAKLRFLSVMGIELNTDAAIVGELTVDDKAYEFNKCLAWAFQNRPEVGQTRFQETIDGLKLNLSISERYPTVTLGASYEWVGEEYPFPNKNWMAVLNLNLPVFDGWALISKIKQKKIMARQGRLYQAEIEDKIDMEVREACMDHSFWSQRYEQLKKRRNISQDPQTQLSNMLIWIETVEQLLSSRATLDWATGKSLSELK